MNTPNDLLEAYLRAKDFNQPDLILDCYTADAILTYSIATKDISFPAKVVGADAIAQTLVRDFRKSFDCCKTWYVCESIAPDALEIRFLPWLVVMRQIEGGALRLGKGYYRWSFARDASGIRVSAMHIHIDRMDVIEDVDGRKRQTLQDGLPYPWLQPAVLGEFVGRLMRQGSGFAFLEDFQQPVARRA